MTQPATERPISTVFALLCQLWGVLGHPPINQFPGCWELQIDDEWWVAINGHGEARKTATTPRGGIEGEHDCPPFTALLYYNGWPAGVFDPYGGVCAAGEGANEDTLVAAIRARHKLEESR